MYCTPKALRPAEGGGGVVLDILWFERDPEIEPDIQPVLVDQVILPAASVALVTDALIDEALNRRKPEVERMVAPPPTPPAAVRSMLGRARHVDGVGRSRAAREIRDEAEAAERRAEATKGRRARAGQS